MRKAHNKLNLVGQIFGDLTVINEADPYVSPKGKRMTKWLCKCKCGNTKTVIGNSLTKGATKSCGCLQKSVATKNVLAIPKGGSITHGDSRKDSKHHYLYETWCSIKQRCNNPNNKSYARYGNRGINMYRPWLEDYNVFKEYILSNLGERPEGMSLDRINNHGNYEPGNCRWANAAIQRINQRLDSRNTSGYKGVYLNKKSNKWFASITVRNTQIHLGHFDTIDQALAARLAAEKKYHAPYLICKGTEVF